MSELHFIYTNIWTMRKYRGISQMQMASRLGITQHTYSEWETGKRELTLSRIQRISDALDIPAQIICKPPKK